MTQRSIQRWSRWRRTAFCSLGVMTLAVYGGPEWPEMGDAGAFIGTAQDPGLPTGRLTKISGSLVGTPPSPIALETGPGGDFQDLYVIYIRDVSCFLATLDPLLDGQSNFDTQLFLFGADGTGLLANDNIVPEQFFSELQPVATDVQDFRLERNGLYVLGITGVDSDAANVDGRIFDQVDPFEISSPDGPGGILAGGVGVLEFWQPPMGDVGDYEIVVNGVYALNDINCRADCAPVDPTTCEVGNGVVNVDDLLEIINAFGFGYSPCDIMPFNADQTYGNHVVNVDDLLEVINQFGIFCGDFS